MTLERKVEDVFVSVIAVAEPELTDVEEFISSCVDLLRSNYANYELVLIDNGISAAALADVNASLRRHACIRVIRLSQRESHDVAVFAGLEASIGDFVVSIVPGFDPVQIIGAVISHLRAGNGDILFGLSSAALRRTTMSRLGTKLFYWYSARVMNLQIPMNSTYLIGMNRRTVNALTVIRGRYRHVRQLARQVGFTSDVLEYTPNGVEDPNNNRSFGQSVNQAVEIAITYSRHPLRFLSWLGLVGSALNLLYALYAVITYFVQDKVATGWTTLSLEMAVMFFFLFLILTVMAEYVGRTLEEARGQPAYHIMEELNSTVLIADETRRNVTK